MNGRRIELQHYTREQVREHLADALELLAELEVPLELQPIALQLAYGGLSAKNVTVEAIAPTLLPQFPGAG